MIPRVNNKRLIAFALALASVVSARAETGSEIFSDWVEPNRVNNLEAFEGSVRIQAAGSNVRATVAYSFPNENSGRADCTWDPELGVAAFSIPAEPNAGLGYLSYSVEVIVGDTKVSSEQRQIQMTYAEELDITGEAAVALLYPLPGHDYVVSYTPCCNIYGGITYAERTGVNPTDTTEGLPEHLETDFVILEPDPLSASTMGLYFVFTYDPPESETPHEDQLVLYEFNGKDAWIKVLSYDVDTEANTVHFHCPDGGIFVLGRDL